MKSDTGIVMNILLGIVGAAVASALLGLVGVSFGGLAWLSCYRVYRSLDSYWWCKSHSLLVVSPRFISDSRSIELNNNLNDRRNL